MPIQKVTQRVLDKGRSIYFQILNADHNRTRHRAFGSGYAFYGRAFADSVGLPWPLTDKDIADYRAGKGKIYLMEKQLHPLKETKRFRRPTAGTKGQRVYEYMKSNKVSCREAARALGMNPDSAYIIAPLYADRNGLPYPPHPECKRRAVLPASTKSDEFAPSILARMSATGESPYQAAKAIGIHPPSAHSYVSTYLRRNPTKTASQTAPKAHRPAPPAEVEGTKTKGQQLYEYMAEHKAGCRAAARALGFNLDSSYLLAPRYAAKAGLVYPPHEDRRLTRFAPKAERFGKLLYQRVAETGESPFRAAKHIPGCAPYSAKSYLRTYMSRNNLPAPSALRKPAEEKPAVSLNTDLFHGFTDADSEGYVAFWLYATSDEPKTPQLWASVGEAMGHDANIAKTIAQEYAEKNGLFFPR